MRSELTWALLPLLLLAACSGDDDTMPRDSGMTPVDAGPRDAGSATPDTGSTSDAGAIDSSMPAEDSGMPTADSGTPAGDCPDGMLCLAVRPFEPGALAPGRLVGIWFQLSDDGPDPPLEIAYDAPFDPTATRIDVPLAPFAAPSEAVLLCERACTDEAVCPCTGSARAGIGLVLVVHDANGNGAIEVPEVQPGVRGVAQLAMGWSATDQIPAPPPLDAKYIDGVLMGSHPYLLVRRGSFDDLAFPAPGMVFDLVVCTAAFPGCDPPFPNLT